jgi:ubiquinol-cytochrome c reductase cytochrome c subunit
MRVSNDQNLNAEAKRDVIAYLTSLDEMPSYGGFGLGGLGPVPEGMAAWLLGIGACVGAAVWIAAHTTRSNKKKADA